MSVERVDVCVVGGGPGGMMAGLLLARQGLEVVVLERHADFLRDFRGDTVHPSTLQVLEELGLVEEFLKIHHIKAPAITMETAMGPVTFSDFTRLRSRYPYMAFMPQWDVLNFLAEAGRRYPGFRLLQEATVTGLVTAGGHVTGVRADTPQGPVEFASKLVVAADGRHSTMRAHAGLRTAESVAPMDALWFRLSREDGEVYPTIRAGNGFLIGTINRGDFWQIVYMIPKGGYGAVREAGLGGFRDAVAAIHGGMRERLEKEINDWDDIKLLDVRIDRLRRWYRPGLVCVGDAAHAMSPAGGVGINLAIQDAVAAARILGPVLREGRTPTLPELRRVQRRRQFPMRVVQFIQLRLLSDLYPSATRKGTDKPLVPRLGRRFPVVPRLLARIVGLGVRPESVGADK
ncbi:FAD-dependent oxidoreductase [Streptomyces sp. NBC_01429]|uniref:FAD-dependent oxidoreductase n=1 Tax=Streptomyces sp. NBC_01429 TaxID=2903862 RepID=UPI002E2A49D1|nr:FAD-dependent oxidoreductase [Streptomyces sp. NBC_01429]